MNLQIGNEASQRREVRFIDSEDKVKTVKGDAVYSVSDRGVIVALNAMRLFIPWHRVRDFSYHNDDVSVRKFFQGF